MKRKINIVEGAMKYHQIILVFIVVMMVLGAIGLKNMPRNEFPEFTIRQGVIVGIYPGATSSEVEQQLTTEVENYIFGYKEINKDKTYSLSQEGQMTIFVELNDNVKNSDQVWSKLRLGLDELKMRLPTGVLALVGTNDFGDTSALLITMSSEEKSYRQLEELMKDLESDIRKVESVSKIKHYGTQHEKVYVYVQQEKLNEYNIQPTTILASFKAHELLNYAGELDNGEMVLPVHLPPRFTDESDLEEQVIYSDPDGNIIRLKDIARVERRYESPDSYIRNNGNNALLLSLEMQQGNNIVQFGEEVQEVIANFIKHVPADVKINIISNQPEVVDEAISHFLREFVIAIVAVILVTMFLLPLRIASVAGVTIPISVLITLGIMQMLGIQLDIVSLAGLIVVLGMVVDNAIVVIDNHVEKLDQGERRWQAAWKAATELFIPVLSATAAIIAAFFPLMLYVKGMAADFVGSFPVTIGIALVISMIVAVFLVPFLCYVFIKRGLHAQKPEGTKKSNSLLDRLQNGYNAGLEWTFRHPYITLGGAVLSVALGMFLFSRLDMQFFPAMDRSQFAVEVSLPEGSSLKKTEATLEKIENILMNDPRVTNVATFVGSGSPRFHTLYAPHMPAKNYGQIMVNTISNDATLAILDEYSEKYRNAFPEANVKWKQIAMEKFDAPVEVRISGDNIADLKAVGEQVAQILNDNEKTTWVRNDWREMRQGITIELDKNKANRMGYAKSLIAASIMTSLDGVPLTTMWEDDYPVDVILSKEEDLKDDIRDLGNQHVSSPLTFESLPLRTVAKLVPEWTEGCIVHRNGVRTLTVSADIKRNIIYSTVFKELKPKIEELELPEGVKISYGGDDENTAENIVPLYYALITSVVLILFILLLQFKTIRRSLLIMSTMLLSLLGASLGLLVVGYPFSMTAFIGVIGLMGITVRNGIILIDYAMKLVTREGYSYREAAIAAGKRRMRPIFLTSMAAAMGVVPMIISASPLWAPLGTVICFGLIFGMILTLFTVPVLYWRSAFREKYKDFGEYDEPAGPLELSAKNEQ